VVENHNFKMKKDVRFMSCGMKVNKGKNGDFEMSEVRMIWRRRS